MTVKPMARARRCDGMGTWCCGRATVCKYALAKRSPRRCEWAAAERAVPGNRRICVFSALAGSGRWYRRGRGGGTPGVPFFLRGAALRLDRLRARFPRGRGREPADQDARLVEGLLYPPAQLARHRRGL